MALTKCKECGNEISTKADACPKCGAKVRRTSSFTKFVLFLIGLGVIATFIAGQSWREAANREVERRAAITPEQKASDDKRNAANAAQAASNEKQRTGMAWRYDEQTDPLDGRKTKWAIIASANEIDLAFPYQGPQRATLQLRIHPRWGRNAFISIDRGQFLCQIDGCGLAVRFDTGKPQTFGAGEPDDHSSTTLFIRDYGKFVSQLKRAHKVTIETQFFQQGPRVFEFNVDGLEWQT